MEGDVYSSLLNLKEKIKKIPKDELANCLDNYHLDPDFMKLKEQISSQITYETASNRLMSLV